MKVAYPGSFDPISNGHLDIIRRLSKKFDEVHIIVSYNVKKKTTFTASKRVSFIEEACKDYPNVYVHKSDDLVVRYCKELGIDIIIRGLRNYQDYENEFSLYQYNKDLDENIETLIMFPSSKNQFISSSAIKELIAFDIDISPYVPKCIVSEVTKALNTKVVEL